jgi:hypothetical protein
MNTPLVVILDLDQTIVGSASPIVAYWAICRELNKLEDTNIYCPKEEIIKSLNKGFLRPHLKTFVDKIKNQFENVEFFVYTASRDPYATELIGYIEEITDISFNRPVFSRNKYCIFGYKLLSLILPDIHALLSPKYDNISQEMLYNNTVVIDDNINAYDEHNDLPKIIQSPRYEYICFIDILDKIPNDIANKHYRVIAQTITGTTHIPFTEDDLSSFEKFKSKWDKLMYNARNNFKNPSLQLQNSKHEDYWKTFDVAEIHNVLNRI